MQRQITDFLNEDILKEELKKGNRQTMAFLMDEYHKPLCAYIYGLSNDYDLAQDIVQNVMIKIWEDRKRMTSTKSIKKYLYRAAYNRMLNHWRDNKKLLSIEEKHLEALHTYVENENHNSLKNQIELVRKEIEKLPTRCRETFLLSKQEGLTHIEIADFMNVSLRTVEAQMHKAFKILRERLENEITPILFLLFDLRQDDTY